MERLWIKTCVKVQFRPSFLTQAEQPQRTALKREFVFWWSKLMQTFFRPVEKKKKIWLFSSFSSVLATSGLMELPVANAGLLISGIVETVWLKQSTKAVSDVPNIKTLDWCRCLVSAGQLFPVLTKHKEAFNVIVVLQNTYVVNKVGVVL